jgi:hypothetical protein
MDSPDMCDPIVRKLETDWMDTWELKKMAIA